MLVYSYRRMRQFVVERRESELEDLRAIFTEPLVVALSLSLSLRRARINERIRDEFARHRDIVRDINLNWYDW